MTSADTSFLFSLYGNDVHSAEAARVAKDLKRPILVSSFGEFELSNAFRFAVSRGFIGEEEADGCLMDFAEDRKAGRILLPVLNLAAAVDRAMYLSASHRGEGYRSFDILLVAAALEIGAERFLSFNDDQRRLAADEGMEVLPQSLGT